MKRQKLEALNEIKMRRNELMLVLQTQENFKMHKFEDLSELRFLNDQYIRIYEIRNWFFDFKVFFSVLISLATAVPEIIANIPF